MRVSKPKAKALNICCDVFDHNCQFAMMFNALLQIHSGVCVPKIIKIERDLPKLLIKRGA